ncbi:type III PLP-dependent enzyme [Tsukamurella ocularis]|uniref:type III PLP-dependent enzyme n=1 Tax=Tsukamurella ocularis TaxID=1970234 RepID=UPI0021680286|nr:type III PLP-dependent enzyme [Tsukamurella ocularis]MCS3780416.1 diaminopimelate decarboxylase [Tsukamurella ocularis]MCS3786029.1 diaminopimelate decarboxylase [Tsukamurella ocularis]MCS3849393.1 diaminopimelate decarboxylase [Tsukamurella ocularis]
MDDELCEYRYDLQALGDHVTTAVAKLPSRCRMFYAMKANSAAPILRTVAARVNGFEVASGGELRKARAADPAAEILFGGPAKSNAEIALAVRDGNTRIHAESLLELHRISSAAVAAETKVEVLLRVNIADSLPAATISMGGRPTPFGIDERLLPEAVQLASNLPGLRFRGFHLHSLSNNLDHCAHLQMLELYRDKALDWEARFGVRIEHLDVGGGIGVNYHDLSEQFDWDAFTVGLARLVDTFPAHWRTIDFECGRYLVAGCGRYLVEVIDIKRNHGVDYVIVRGGTHHFRLPASWQHSHPFTVHPTDRVNSGLPRPEVVNGPVNVVGELCTPKDVLAQNVHVARIRTGDVLAFEYAGAYGWDISHHDFLSHPHPDLTYQ